jgi:hypothetical protein
MGMTMVAAITADGALARFRPDQDMDEYCNWLEKNAKDKSIVLVSGVEDAYRHYGISMPAMASGLEDRLRSKGFQVVFRHLWDRSPKGLVLDESGQLSIIQRSVINDQYKAYPVYKFEPNNNLP